MKIQIIGYSGSGKSTLAKFLSTHYALPCLHLDTMRFLPQWQERPDEDMKRLVDDFLCHHDSWVMDGNYSFCSYEQRMKEADTIIFLNFSPWNCLYRAFKRSLRYRGQTREDMTPGCPEKFDWEFIRWILKDGRQERAKRRYQKVCQTYSEKVVMLCNQRELDAFLEHVQKL
ncbi:DNA topology modulation protein [Streptococcus himalayensis]|uniref:DNA topology modulation protein FlaR n=1 Tax=Streptococcus himalayensis TaxID=1888195 RepID=A0A917A8P3_9STRE|nr:DNA topology modulation protein [Streptococcus himalayensis]GGE35691.1 DNA topology modulation protein FlaR [Streptococcus himalayensis]